MGWWLFSTKSVCGTSISSSSCCCCKNQNTQTKKKSSLSPYFGSTEEPTPTKSPNSEHGMHHNWSKFHSRRSKPQPLIRNPHPLGGNPTLPTKTTIKIDIIRQNKKKGTKIKQANKRKRKTTHEIENARVINGSVGGFVEWGVMERTSIGAGVITVMAIVQFTSVALLMEKQWKREKEERESKMRKEMRGRERTTPR